jgi:flavin-dependent dehydrogenase
MANCAHARELLRGAEPLGPLRGAPLRCDLEGARRVAPGLIVAGEGIGTTYSFSGEGIGKAMESGRMAGRVAASCVETGRFDAWALGAYANAIDAAGFPEKFRRYRMALRWLAIPQVVNLLAWRAARGDYVQTVLEGVIREQRLPDEIFSARGILRALVS